ncbi:MAG: toxin-antitoxin system YwqK family antitoxin [Bacteroidetes bacterium]|nr:toxin-antitoxin system YwqK family antitoxin [Bacteroidota bacterium]
MIKKSFLLATLCAGCLSTKAQPAVYASIDTTRTKVEGKKNLEFLEVRNQSDEIAESGYLLQGKKDGVWKKYYTNGPLNRLEEYSDGVLNGTVVELNRGGTIDLDENYVDGKLHGLRVKYHYGMQSVIEHYKSGLLHGEKIMYYENSQKQEEGVYNNGKREGETKWYNQDGKLITMYTYKDGRLEGPIKEYYANGTVQKEGNHINDVEEGEWKEYSEDGKLKKTVLYKNGTVVKEILAK